jgi:hypothetical protein
LFGGLVAVFIDTQYVEQSIVNGLARNIEGLDILDEPRANPRIIDL